MAFSGRPASDLLLFLRYEESFRPGGIGISGSNVHRFDRNSLITIETGVRWSPSGADRLDASVALAYTRWDNIQAAVIDISNQVVTANIGDGRIYTLDAKLAWRATDQLALEAAAVVNDSLVTDPRELSIINADRNGPLPNVARVNARLAATFQEYVPGLGDMRLSAAGRYVGRSRLGLGGVLAQEQGDWWDISVGASVQSGAHRFNLGISNLLDSVGNRFSFGSPFLIWKMRQITPLPPRTLRVGWEARF